MIGLWKVGVEYRNWLWHHKAKAFHTRFKLVTQIHRVESCLFRKRLLWDQCFIIDNRLIYDNGPFWWNFANVTTSIRCQVSHITGRPIYPIVINYVPYMHRLIKYIHRWNVHNNMHWEDNSVTFDSKPHKKRIQYNGGTSIRGILALCLWEQMYVCSVLSAIVMLQCFSGCIKWDRYGL